MMSFAATPNDAVMLKPAWAALLSSLRFARRGRWHFGNGTGMLSCREGGPRRWLTERSGTDGLRFRFDQRRWHSAFARSTGAAREIGIVADDGSAVATIQLEAVDAAIDELIWRLIDDDAVAPVTPTGEPLDRKRVSDELALAASRDAFDALAGAYRLARNGALTLAGSSIARPLAPDVLPRAMHAARAAGLALRVRVENAGGRVTWNPADVALTNDDASITVRAGGVDVRVSAGDAALWAVALETPDACCPALECCVPGDRGWIRIDVAADTEAACATWRRICATLPEEQ
jgi:putative heme degradation protein